ncbi:RNA polymerase sigma-70 factor, ECF subfamily [Paenimyroides ummariense]|uniref:RNA polymerase sigma-70 factor, ECF subfamily n=1 Tax=Paenimyroides ummariense TaxID=913024 RepID=A0A1I4Z5L9_9FLAO|nr:sigma-70 family RNA polymerase sigma factor [Paenimyroides ummariense]SFN45562.1 RNA polymerase sigma-70 factor, ECF subfamily [Paenimyroides ummariense]
MFGQLKNQYQSSDTFLVDLIVKSGEGGYFKVIYDRYAHFVYNKCFGFVKEKEEAKDLTQEIFIKIYLNLPKFKGNSKLSTWIYAITINANINHISKNKHKTVALLDDHLTDHSLIENSDDAELFDTNYEKLEQLMDVLPEDDRRLLIMKYQDNLPIKQMIKILNIKESAVKMRLLRAKKKVKKLEANLRSA